MDFAVILPSMAFSFNGGVCVYVCITASTPVYHSLSAPIIVISHPRT